MALVFSDLYIPYKVYKYNASTGSSWVYVKEKGTDYSNSSMTNDIDFIDLNWTYWVASQVYDYKSSFISGYIPYYSLDIGGSTTTDAVANLHLGIGTETNTITDKEIQYFNTLSLTESVTDSTYNNIPFTGTVESNKYYKAVRKGNSVEIKEDVIPALPTLATVATTGSYNDLTNKPDPYDDTVLDGRVTTIENMIPSQASSSNQLADKSFVNSTVGTNTAIFRGTFNSLAELQAYSGEKTNNDYAFVIETDSAGNELYKRYKYNGSTWVYEYTLNNSSFTANQWNTINSGMTSSDKTKLDSMQRANVAQVDESDFTTAYKNNMQNGDLAIVIEEVI